MTVRFHPLRLAVAGVVAVTTVVLAAGPAVPAVSEETSAPASAGLDKIRHVVVIMQENHSFDHYFGTFPGADGIPMVNGVPTVCSPDPRSGECVAPYHDTSVTNGGGPHSLPDTMRDIDHGKMDGFVATAQSGLTEQQRARPGAGHDVMGYHDATEIPNYWQYARQFVLQDHMFAPLASWSLPEHLSLVSAWSALCSRRDDPMSCKDAPQRVDLPPDVVNGNVLTYGRKVDRPNYAWTDLTWLLHRAHVTWRYYLAIGAEPDCRNPAQVTCPKVPQRPHSSGIWNPLPYFTTVNHDHQLGNIQDTEHLYQAARAGTLPAVSWVIPNHDTSEHPPQSITDGQAYVTRVVNAIMRGPDWDSTAIFISWDEMGGFYDHVPPPIVGGNQYGLRVPGLVISPYARQGIVDHQTLSFDAYVRFIEDRFLGGQRLDPATDGRPDPRPSVRETAPGLGDLTADFDFAQAPRPAGHPADASHLGGGSLTPPVERGRRDVIDNYGPPVRPASPMSARK